MFGMHDMRATSASRQRAGRSDDVSGEAYRTTGLVAGTRIATAMGWRAVEAIAVGDLVLTFDNGLQPVVAEAVMRGDAFLASFNGGDR